MKKWEKFTKDELQKMVEESYSYAQLAEKVGYTLRGGSGQVAVKKMCEEYRFSTVHFSQKLRPEQINIEQSFGYFYVRRETLRNKLLALRGAHCECCGLDSWNNLPITLQVHHVDGDNFNNTLENLQLLCPNCHSQTDNFCGKNKTERAKDNCSDEEWIEALKTSPNIHQALLKLKKADGNWYTKAYALIKKYNIQLEQNKIQSSVKVSENIQQHYCQICGAPITSKATYCSKCAHIQSRTCERPSREELKTLIRTNNFCAIAKTYNVTDNAVRKWCKAVNLPFRVKDIKALSDEEWQEI